KFVVTNCTAFADEHGHKYPNLFQEMQSIMPGDEVEQKIRVDVTNVGSGSAIITLKMERAEDDNVTAQEIADYETLLQNAEFTVTNGKTGEALTGKLGEGVKLGRLYAGDSVDLNVKLSLPIEAGDELQGLQAAVGWVFTAEYIPGGGGGTVIPEPSTPGGPPELDTSEHFAYIVGRYDGLVHPEAEITRAEVATIFFRLLTEDSRNQFWATTNPYNDVPESAWFNKAVSTLTNAGIIYGKPGGNFDPDAPITRAEFAAIAVRFFGGDYSGEDQFSDITGHWASADINKAVVNNLVSGYPDGTFRPDNNIVRSEAISIVNRVLNRKPDADHLLDGMKTWPDNMDTSAWYYADMQEATNSHNYDLSVPDEDGSVYEIWFELLPIRDWVTLERAWTDSNQSVNPGEVISSKTNTEVK
ncbi:MAG: S-layer homology domain-containing protein, partial [Clostridiales bacterium]|nr:S-layer homology domain-containing protein [Clostridiales bacterium]